MNGTPEAKGVGAAMDDAAPEVPHTSSAGGPHPGRAGWPRWAFALVPLLGLVELTAHVVEIHRVVPEADWKAARDVVASIVQPDDDVLFAPRWTDPLGREHFGDAITTLAREAAGDVTRFPRALEVSTRGKHRPELEGWRTIAEHHAGAITVLTKENPHPVTLHDDLVARFAAGQVDVERRDGDRASPCSLGQMGVQAGSLGSGPALPASRYACPGGNTVALTVVNDTLSQPHHCIFAPPPGGTAAVRLRFPQVQFGQVLHGHVGLQSEAERDRRGTPVTLTFRHGNGTLGEIVHLDGEGWKGFELPTGDLAGRTEELVVDLASSSGNRRLVCFEADTRSPR